jgi:hypothetical protein
MDRLVRQQNRVDDHDHAIALIDGGDRLLGGVALVVGDREILAAALEGQRVALDGLEGGLAVAGLDVGVERIAVDAARNHVID